MKSFANGIVPLTLLTGISIAALFGLVHAFMPGHGKTVLVSYFLGRPSKVVAGLGASIILVLTHVGSAVVLVLTGFIVIRGTIGGAGRAPKFETASAPFIVLIGIWLLYNAVRHRHNNNPTTDGRVLAFVTGLVPCPLTTFIMVYAVSNGIIVAGLLLTAGMSGNDYNNCHFCGHRRAVARAHRSSYGENRADTRTLRTSPRSGQRGRNYRIRVMAADQPLNL